MRYGDEINDNGSVREGRLLLTALVRSWPTPVGTDVLDTWLAVS